MLVIAVSQLLVDIVQTGQVLIYALLAHIKLGSQATPRLAQKALSVPLNAGPYVYSLYLYCFSDVTYGTITQNLKQANTLVDHQVSRLKIGTRQPLISLSTPRDAQGLHPK